MNSGSRFLKLRYLAAILAVVLVFGVLRIISKPLVKAASSRIYPGYCLGGWQNPQNASGEINLELNSQSEEFNSNNSAILDEKSASQIFCGYFQIGDQTNPPQRAFLKFLWTMKFSQPPQEILPGIEAPVFIIEPATSTPSQENQQATSTTPAESAVPSSENPPAEIVPQPEAPIQEIAPAPESTSTPETSEPQAFFKLLINKVFAQSVSQNQTSTGFLEAKYSFDGISWISLGFINSMNYREFSPQIPVNSWDDIRNLQIALFSVPSVDGVPAVFLDGMWIEAEYDQTIIESIQNGTETIVDAVGTAVDAGTEAVSNTLEAITEKFGGSEEKTQAENKEISAPEPVQIKDRELVFLPTDERITAKKSLPWFSRENLELFRKKYGGYSGEVSNAPALILSVDKKSLQINGQCSKDYFVILLYKNAEDYLNQPETFIINQAKPCENGSFSFDFKDVSSKIPSGDYYLLIAEENKNEPWIPSSAIIPIKIDSIVE